jgi:hypothetical protein
MIDFEFLSVLYSQGTRIKYIKFSDSEFRLSNEQKCFLQNICIGFFFYSKTKKMWGFTDRDDNHSVIYNYLKNELASINKSVNQSIAAKSLDDEVKNNKNNSQNFEYLEFKFVKLKGRPLYFTEKVNEKIQVNINLEHSFFVKKDKTEMDFAKKIISTLVLAEQEYTSSIIDSFLSKIITIQEQAKHYFDHDE